ncbi:MAG TPA: YIP1 family protein, partial [Gemmatimonadales bacterium]|nr:YIP1 family protein [Gemmatimonadales bacterium]
MGAFLDVFRVLYEPGAVFGRVAEKPKFLAPFIGIAILAMIVAYLMTPFQLAAMASKMAEVAQANPAAADKMKSFTGIGFVFAPIGYAIVLLIITTVLWVLVSVFGGEGKWGTLLSVATYVSITGILLQLVQVLVLKTKGVEQITSPADLQPALGLNLLAPGMGGFLGGLLGGINPFTIWGAFLYAMGIQVTHKTSKGTAWSVAITISLIVVLIFAAL